MSASQICLGQHDPGPGAAHASKLPSCFSFTGAGGSQQPQTKYRCRVYQLWQAFDLYHFNRYRACGMATNPVIAIRFDMYGLDSRRPQEDETTQQRIQIRGVMGRGWNGRGPLSMLQTVSRERLAPIDMRSGGDICATLTVLTPPWPEEESTCHCQSVVDPTLPRRLHARLAHLCQGWSRGL